eukprot:GEMP01043240.1.p1 GENE.GEMP01043240.1~~GEMP01043240.1.p1  ORF type:complete len:327 (+),score=67.64 GEMP01043240.1:43-1023(+)
MNVRNYIECRLCNLAGAFDGPLEVLDIANAALVNLDVELETPLPSLELSPNVTTPNRRKAFIAALAETARGAHDADALEVFAVQVLSILEHFVPSAPPVAPLKDRLKAARSRIFELESEIRNCKEWYEKHIETVEERRQISTRALMDQNEELCDRLRLRQEDLRSATTKLDEATKNMQQTKDSLEEKKLRITKLSYVISVGGMQEKLLGSENISTRQKKRLAKTEERFENSCQQRSVAQARPGSKGNSEPEPDFCEMEDEISRAIDQFTIFFKNREETYRRSFVEYQKKVEELRSQIEQVDKEIRMKKHALQLQELKERDDLDAVC